MVREKSELLPLPLNRAGVPECLVLPFLIRSFGVCPGFCWYQNIHGAPPPHVATAELVLQVRVTVDPGVDVTSGGWVTVTWPLHPVKLQQASVQMRMVTMRVMVVCGFCCVDVTGLSPAALNSQDYKPSQFTGGSADDAKPPLYGNEQTEGNVWHKTRSITTWIYNIYIWSYWNKRKY